MEAKSSERIRRALRYNVRTYADEGFVTGDCVYYRRQNYNGWHGPAKVLGKEGQCVLIRHGGAFFRMHPCHLMEVDKELQSPRNEENTNSSNEMNDVLEEEDEGQYNNNSISNRKEVKDNRIKPSRNEVVEYKLRGSDEWKKGMVMSTQPKSTGKYSHWLNIKPEAENEDHLCVNWDHVDQWRKLSHVTEGTCSFAYF